jgi:hypothetical protein
MPRVIAMEKTAHSGTCRAPLASGCLTKHERGTPPASLPQRRRLERNERLLLQVAVSQPPADVQLAVGVRPEPRRDLRL